MHLNLSVFFVKNMIMHTNISSPLTSISGVEVGHKKVVQEFEVSLSTEDILFLKNAAAAGV